MNKLLPFLILIVAAAALAYFVFAGGDPDQGDFVELPPAEFFEDEVRDGEATAEASDEERVDRQLESEVGNALREYAEEGGAAASHFTLQVWDRKFGVPAAGASVHFLVDPPWRSRDEVTEHESLIAEREGARFTTDAKGRAQLPACRRQAYLAVTLGESFAYKRIWSDHPKRIVLVLQPDETVTIRVVDERGKGLAGVPVGLLQTLPERGPTREQVRTQQRQVQAELAALRERAEQLRQRAAQARTRSNERSVAGVERQRASVAMQLDRLSQVLATLRRFERGRDGGRDRLAVARMNTRNRNRERARAAARAARAARGARSPSARKAAPPTQVRPKPPTASAEKPAIRLPKRTRARLRTDADGFAVLRHFQLVRVASRDWWPVEARDQFVASLLVPLQQSVQRTFRGKPLPAKPVELVMPATGSLRLRTVDRDGRPFLHPVHARLRIEGTTGGRRQMRVRKEQDQEFVDFPYVGLGLQLRADCRLDDDDFRWVAPVLEGPREAGEVVVRDLVVAPDAGAFVGRVLDTEAAPLARAKLSFLINASTGRLEGEDVTLDRDGRFYLAYKVREERQPPPYRLEIRHRRVTPTAGLVRALARLDMRRIVDLGDLQLEDFARLAKGRVVDDRGLPVEGASVQLQRERPRSARPGPAPAKPTLRYLDEAFVSARSDADGRYELFAQLETGRYRLRVRARDHFPFETTGLPPSGVQDLRLTRRARVVGVLQLPDWLDSKRVRAVLTGISDPKFRREDRLRKFGGKVLAFFDWVRPGSYRLELRLRGFPDPVHTIDSFVLRAGQTKEHPRLAQLDLRSRLHRYEIVAVDAQGAPVRPRLALIAQVQRSGGRLAPVGLRWRGNRIDFIAMQPSLAVTPLARGYHATQTRLAPGRSTIQFLKMPSVVVHAPGLGELGRDVGVFIALEALSNGSGIPAKLESWDSGSRAAAMMHRRANKWTGGRLGSGDRASIKVVRDGRYAVYAFFGFRRGRPERVRLHEFDLRISPGGGDVLVRVTAPAKEVAAAIARVRQRTKAKAAGK